MKKVLILLFVFLIAYSTSIYAQYSRAEYMQKGGAEKSALSAGLLFGAGASSTHEPETNKGDWGVGFSFAAGAFCRYIPHKNAALQADMIYTNGSSYDALSDQQYSELQYHASTIQIPLSLLISPNHLSNNANLYAGGGCFAAVPMSAKFQHEIHGKLDVKDQVPDLLYGYNVIIGIEAMKVIAELRYSYELNGYGYDNVNRDLNNWNVRVLMGYPFF